jgi:hypothetical protein
VASRASGDHYVKGLLTADEMRTLQRDQEACWSVVPLKLPEDWLNSRKRSGKSSSSMSSAVATADRSRIISSLNPHAAESAGAEVGRLSEERAFLLKRISDLIRTSDRRVETARGIFQASISKVIVKLLQNTWITCHTLIASG